MNEADERFDAVVIGSGFGGGIAALRLAQAGARVLVLERGRRWGTQEPFPRDVRDLQNLLWRPNDRRPCTGLYDPRFFDALGALVASGVGGGSLIYACVHVRPDDSVFEGRGWPSGIARNLLDPYFDRVAEELRLSPLPPETDVPKRSALRRAAESVGREAVDPPMAVRWQADSTPGCRLVAECEFGCPHGAKNSVDLTYIAKAETLGAEVRALAEVRTIVEIPGGYRCGYRDLRTRRAGQVTAPLLVVAAGTLGTTELLLRAQHQRTLPRLSDDLGRGYSANGDFLGMVEGTLDLDTAYGTDVTSIVRYFDGSPGFTVAAPTFQATAMAVAAGISAMPLRIPGWLVWWLLRRYHPFLLRSGLLSKPRRLPFLHRPDPSKTTFLFAIGQDTANGHLRLANDHLNIDWKYSQDNQVLIRRTSAALQELARSYGGSFQPLPTWRATKKPFTVHSLGGCRMADHASNGVVSPEGQVFGHDGLFVADGSVIPTSIGFHPAMTIAAVAERIAEHALTYAAAA
jgi:cholesterol oxidase